MSKKLICAVMAIVMVLSLAACGKSEPTAPVISTTINGTAVENGAAIIDNVPMVKGDVVGSTAEYLTLEEVENMGFTVVYNNDELTISRVQDINGEINNDVNVNNPNASTDVIGGNNTDNTEDPVDTPNGTENEGNVSGETDKPVVNENDKPVSGGNTETTEPVTPTEPTKPEVKPTEKPTETVKPEEKPADKPEHTHKFTDTVVNPTCTKDGYTEHKCACGESYKDTVKSATGHKYNDKVVAPTTSEKGYTLHTCSVCGDSYKDNYTDKLPAEKPGKDEYVNDGGESNTVEENAGLVAGKMVSGEKAEYRPAPNPNADKNTAVEELNELAFFAYGGFRFFDDGIAKNYEDEGKFAKFVTHSDGRTGINVFGWRKGYDSSEITNFGLNLVLESFYYMTGDREVAKALWDVVDYLNINGGSISNDRLESMGFSLSNETASSIEMTMNGVHIYWEWPAGTASNIFYFG